MGKDYLKMPVKEAIYELALQGLTNEEIAQKLFVSKYYVSECIRKLHDDKTKYYNIELENKIFLARELNNFKDFDKDLLDEIVFLSLRGLIAPEIAIKLDIDINTVEEFINVLGNVHHIFYNNEVYLKIKNVYEKEMKKIRLDGFKRLALVEQELGDLLKKSSLFTMTKFYGEYTRYKTYKLIVQEFIASDMTLTDQQLAYRCNAKKATVYKLLSNRLPAPYLEIITGKVMAEKIMLARKKLGLNMIKQNINNFKQGTDSILSSEDKKFKAIKSSKLYEKLAKRPLFWLNYMLTFRLSFKDFGDILGVTDYNLLKQCMVLLADYQSLTYLNAVMFLDSVAKENEGRKTKALNWLNEYKMAKDKEKRKELIGVINNAKYNEIMKKEASFEKLSLEERNVIMAYKIKYALPKRSMGIYSQLLKEKYPKEYQEQLNELIKFNLENAKRYMSGTYVKEKMRDDYMRSCQYSLLRKIK